MQQLLAQMQYTCDKLTTKEEIAIIKKYGWKAKCYAKVVIRKKIFQYYYI